ncbi:MAG: VOC family protein [Pseudomonadota bacterium]
MRPAKLEHVNVTVSDPDRTAAMMCDLFDWKIRWSGASMMGGETVHVGDDDAYLAVYSHNSVAASIEARSAVKGGLNHIGVVVDDLEATAARVKAAGFKLHNYGDYEPGRRFYFHDADGVEYEVVSYARTIDGGPVS